MSIEKSSSSANPGSNDKLISLARSIGELAARADVFTRHQLIPTIQSAALTMNLLATDNFHVSPGFGRDTKAIIGTAMKKSTAPEGTEVVGLYDKKPPMGTPHIVVFLSKSSELSARKNFPDAINQVYLDVEHSDAFKL